MILLIAGGLLIGAAAILDTVFRERMTRIGHKAAMIEGGAFNYSEYHRVRARFGWPAWPVYLMWLLVSAGIGLLIGGFFTYLGTSPRP